MKRIVSKNLTGERALFKCRDTHISDSSFFDGESPLKESKNILVERCTFSWKYPLWYSSSINVFNSRFTAEARAGIWYTSSIVVKDVIYEAVKGFRKCNNLILENVTFNDKDVTETLWNCHSVTIKNVKIGGPYFGMGCSSVKIDNLYIDANMKIKINIIIPYLKNDHININNSGNGILDIKKVSIVLPKTNTISERTILKTRPNVLKQAINFLLI